MEGQQRRLQIILTMTASVFIAAERPLTTAPARQEELLPVKNKQLFSLMRQRPLFSPLWSISPRLKTTPRMSDANMGIISVKSKRQTQKLNEKNKYQTSEKKNKTAFRSISRRQRSLGHRASAHHFLSRPGGIDAGQNMKVRGTGQHT